MASDYGGKWRKMRDLARKGQGLIEIVTNIQDNDGKEYALKRLQRNASKQPRERFAREVQALQTAEHPNILKVLDFDVDASPPYYVMELQSGGNLVDLMARRKPLDYKTIQSILTQVAGALVHGITHQITHRDLKPENILLNVDETTVYLADWGICYIEGGEQCTLADEVVGTRFFCDPLLEKGRLGEFDMPATDVYSFGKLVYWLFSNGVIPRREEFRDPEDNLCNIRRDMRLEHINLTLDRMITSTLEGRFPSVREAWNILKIRLDLLSRGFNVVSPTVPQPCTYCGLGFYQPQPDAQNSSINAMGLPIYAGVAAKILLCDQCGHAQYFRIDNAQRKEDWWGHKG